MKKVKNFGILFTIMLFLLVCAVPPASLRHGRELRHQAKRNDQRQCEPAPYPMMVVNATLVLANT